MRTLRWCALSALVLSAVLTATALAGPVDVADAARTANDDILVLDRDAVAVLDTLTAGDIDAATHRAADLAHRFPDFALAQLLHAELASVAALDGTLTASQQAWPPRLLDLLLEARARLDARNAAAGAMTNSLPAPFLQIGAGIDHLIVVDAARSLLSLHAVRDGVSTRLREHYVSSGSAGYGKRREGDHKTPLGLYRITGRRDDASLPELYGAGALMLDYPNAFDRAAGRTGSGIWLHGIPHARRSRAPRSSEGCVAMSNNHLRALYDTVMPATTLVLIGADLDVKVPADDSRLAAYRSLFENYRDARHIAPGPDPVLTPVQLAALAGVPADSITILQSEGDRSGAEEPVLIMHLSLPFPAESGLTLYWSRSVGGDWTLQLESVSTLDS